MVTVVDGTKYIFFKFVKLVKRAKFDSSKDLFLVVQALLWFTNQLKKLGILLICFIFCF